MSNKGKEKKHGRDREVKPYLEDNQEYCYRVAFHYTANPELAKDALQEAIIKAMVHYSQLRNEKYMKTWFYRILVNECKTVLKKFPRREEFDMTWIPDTDAGDQNLKLAVNHCLESLKPQYRDIIYLRFYQGFEFQEISRNLGMRKGTVKSRYYKGMELLKMQWESESHV